MKWYLSSNGGATHHKFICENGEYKLMKTSSKKWALGFKGNKDRRVSIVGQYEQKWLGIDAAKKHYMEWD